MANDFLVVSVVENLVIRISKFLISYFCTIFSSELKKKEAL